MITATGIVAGLSWIGWSIAIAIPTDSWFNNYSPLNLFVGGPPAAEIPRWGAALASLVLAPLAGQRRGRYDAHFGEFSASAKRRARRFIAAGSVLLGFGVCLDLWIIRLGGLNTYGPDFYFNQLGTASIAAGSGLLMYGLEYRRETRILRHIRMRGPSISVSF